MYVLKFVFTVFIYSSIAEIDLLITCDGFFKRLFLNNSLMEMFTLLL